MGFRYRRRGIQNKSILSRALDFRFENIENVQEEAEKSKERKVETCLFSRSQILVASTLKR